LSAGLKIEGNKIVKEGVKHQPIAVKPIRDGRNKTAPIEFGNGHVEIQDHGKGKVIVFGYFMSRVEVA
jgi:hypothetical protein